MDSLVTMYDDLFSHADPRVGDWFMMGSPWPTLLGIAAYIYIANVLGPKLMENRAAFDMRKPMMVYNFSMVIMSGYIFIEFGLSGWFTGYSLGCQPVDYSNTPKALRIANISWIYFMSKFIELSETMFFVLRKKSNQVSFLHVFHHSIMPISWYFGVKFVAGGFGTFHGMVNSWIHFVMYIYYGVAALGPQYQKYLWWKKYMTTMQIIQFVMIAVHCIVQLFITCSYPKIMAVIILSEACIFFFMFADFYRQSYKPKNKAELVNGVNGNNNKMMNGSERTLNGNKLTKLA